MLNLLCFMLLLQADATLPDRDRLHFVDIEITPQTSSMEVKVKAEPLLAWTPAYDRENPDKGMTYYSLDSPIHQALNLIEALDKNRQTFWPKGLNDPLPVARFNFAMMVRTLTGKKLEKCRFFVILGLGEEKDVGYMTHPDGVVQFSIGSLNDQEYYKKFFEVFAFPVNHKVFARPSEEEFLVDLYYQWPIINYKVRDLDIGKYYWSPILNVSERVKNHKVHLGTTFCRWDDANGFQQYNSDHLHYYKDSLVSFAKIVEFEKNGKIPEAVEGLKAHIKSAPANQNALKKLIEIHMANPGNEEAAGMVQQLRPILNAVLHGTDTLKRLNDAIASRRKALLDRKHSFRRDEGLGLTIDYPKADDLIGGHSELRYSLENPEDVPILQIEVFLDDELIIATEDLSMRVPLKAKERKRRRDLRLVCYMENETYQETQIPIKVMNINDETAVNLMRVRAVVTKGPSFVVNLDQTDFSVREHNQQRAISFFKKDQAPLRVAILIDTSTSMTGEKLYRAQYAVRSFLNKLEPADQASIYTFDEKVLRLFDFTNQFTKVTPKLLTLSPQLLTHLHDAIYVAHHDLLKQSGTKVMIIVSDGGDTSSAVNKDQVIEVLESSPVMVYSVLLNNGPIEQAMTRGNDFLVSLSTLTGSTAMEVNDTKELDRSFDRIYNELKSFYYMEFYSRSAEPNIRDIEIDAGGRKHKARFRLIN